MESTMMEVTTTTAVKDFLGQIHPDVTDAIDYTKQLKENVVANMKEKKAFQRIISKRQQETLSNTDIGENETLPIVLVKLEATVRTTDNTMITREAFFFLRGLVFGIVDVLEYLKTHEITTIAVTNLIGAAEIISLAFDNCEKDKNSVFNHDEAGIPYFLEFIVSYMIGDAEKEDVEAQSERLELVKELLGQFEQNTLQRLVLNKLITSTKAYLNRFSLQLRHFSKEGIVSPFVQNSLLANFKLLSDQVERMQEISESEIITLKSVERVSRLALPNFPLIHIVASDVAKIALAKYTLKNQHKENNIKN